ncbi:hypothetical protein M0R45_019153 [Rubus argutus]|uniref:Protein kinase domain-containing protein n=1 Tax=Rubus argutus TaxID=59490 RepID=A0AAW1X6I9_RUBAR
MPSLIRMTPLLPYMFLSAMRGRSAHQSCQSKQVNLEARVVFCSSVGRGLIEEAKSIFADYLLLCGSRNQSHRTSSITRYCLKHAPAGCTLFLMGKSTKPQQKSDSHSADSKESHQSISWRTKNTIQSGRTTSSFENISVKETNKEITSPRAVLDEFEAESQSTDDTGSSGDLTITESSSLASDTKKQGLSPCKFITSFFGSPFRKTNSSLSSSKQQIPSLKCFSYKEIMNSTNSFHPDNLVGRGGYSEVYRGDLSDGQTIAVKMLAKDNNNATNKEKEFLMELGVILHVSHPNTAKLVGCCIENGLYLIFNFTENGTLASALHGKSCESLPWPIRYKIIIGVAKGLHYLHKCCKRRIIHRDIKASNVLLGPDYEPQITDFGLAKWLPNKWTHHAVIPIEGTFGYLAPEYFMHGIVDEKTDVFAFGVLLLEIVTGRKPVDSSKKTFYFGDVGILLHVLTLVTAMPHMESGDIAKLADPKLEGKYDAEQLHSVVLAASYCVRQTSVWRPSMSEVLELLNNGHNSEIARTSILKFSSDELDDYSMVYGYDIPEDIDLEDYL